MELDIHWLKMDAKAIIQYLVPLLQQVVDMEAKVELAASQVDQEVQEVLGVNMLVLQEQVMIHQQVLRKEILEELVEHHLQVEAVEDILRLVVLAVSVQAALLLEDLVELAQHFVLVDHPQLILVAVVEEFIQQELVTKHVAEQVEEEKVHPMHSL